MLKKNLLGLRPRVVLFTVLVPVEDGVPIGVAWVTPGPCESTSSPPSTTTTEGRVETQGVSGQVVPGTRQLVEGNSSRNRSRREVLGRLREAIEVCSVSSSSVLKPGRPYVRCTDDGWKSPFGGGRRRVGTLLGHLWSSGGPNGSVSRTFRVVPFSLETLETTRSRTSRLRQRFGRVLPRPRV